jgi:hypothetical protein
LDFPWHSSGKSTLGFDRLIKQHQLSLFDLMLIQATEERRSRPPIVKRLTALAESARRDLDDSLINTTGSGPRTLGVESP